MSNKEKSYSEGWKDSNAGKGPQNTQNWSWQVRESYNAGYQSGKQNGSGKSGK